MSAFIVSDETMHRVVNVILSNTTSFGNIWTEDKDAGTRIGQLLFKLNALAVNDRYNEAEKAPDYHFREGYLLIQCDLVSAYKSLQCLLYQCAEGDIPEMKLFKELENLSHRLAHKIVSDLPAYSAADWD